MYTIYADNICIHNDMIEVEELRVLSPSLEMSDCAAGSLSFTILPSNPGYSEIELFATTITVLKNGEWFWAGRPISESTDFYNQKTIECEGVLAFLNDTHQVSYVSEGMPPLYSFIEYLLDFHNAKVGNNRKIYKGEVTVHDGYKKRYTEYETTMEAFDDIIKDNGGHLMIRYDSTDGKYYLDYLANWFDTTSQEIRFGSNLMDFTTEASRENFGTAIFPLGAELDDGSRVTIESVNYFVTSDATPQSGKTYYTKSGSTYQEWSGSTFTPGVTYYERSPYLENSEAVSKWGYIEKKFEDTDITSPATLKSVAQTVLNEMISEDISLEISAIDLSMLDNTIEDIRLYDQIRVVSPYHNLDRYFGISSVSLDLAEPQNDTFTLGEEENVSLSSRTSAVSSAGSVDRQANGLTNLGQKILNDAKLNATQIINSATNGFVTTVHNDDGTSELIISDNINYHNATKMWRWNINGLGYSSDGGTTYGLAITMDGSIVADYITAGHMSADRIRAGKLYAQDGYSYFQLDNTSASPSHIHIGSSASYWVELQNNGKFQAGSGANTMGWMNGAANVHNLDDDTYSKGINIVAPYRDPSSNKSIIRLVSDKIAVLSSNDSSQVSTNCSTGTLDVVTNITDNGDGTFSWTTAHVTFINGMLTYNLS